jgi:hypothetical protein|tara:strand:- start:1512 stop:1715 length:204 start_codon:yes stop_codon:yes gene_type:complete
VLGPIITFKGLEAKESTGSFIDITTIHKRGNKAIIHHVIIVIETIILRGVVKLKSLLSIIIFFLFAL